MGFASAWLKKNALFPAFIQEAPEKNTGIIIVIPAYNEPEITILLDSLSDCTDPGCDAEILIVINAPENASGEALKNNRLCIQNIERWKETVPGNFFRLYVFDTGDNRLKEWGVGLARKTGMDEALRRFDAIGNPEGAIVCLDADCTVKQNYFLEIRRNLVDKKDKNACSIYFEHPLSGNGFTKSQYNLISQYELHLRYFVLGLRYSEFPNAFHTVGSSMACKAGQYLRAGGMNRRQAGEDFYFIQKLVGLGGYFALNSTAVYPSSRESFRVPFGTGPTMTRMILKGENTLFTYNFRSFTDLSTLFRGAGRLFNMNGIELSEFYDRLAEGLRSFINKDQWETKIAEIQGNTASVSSFRKRFFGWFNMFRIVKYLNYVHNGFYEKQPVTQAASELLAASGKDIISGDVTDLLVYFRNMELEG